MSFVLDLDASVYAKVAYIPFLIPPSIWKTKFVYTFGFSLPDGVDYEVYYNILYDDLQINRYNHIIRIALRLNSSYMITFLINRITNDPKVSAKKVKLQKLMLFVASEYDRIEILELLANLVGLDEQLLLNSVMFASYGYITKLKHLIINSQALEYAIKSENINVIDFILNNGADIDKLNPILYRTIENVSTEVITYLVCKGLKLNNSLALEIAINNGNILIIKLLLPHCTEISIVIHKILYIELRVLKFLVENSVSLELFNEDLFVNAAIRGKSDIIEFLLAKGMNEKGLIAKSKQWASINGHAKVYKILSNYKNKNVL